ncbi:glycosyltransferase [candidate division WS5 bacterium]|uniref:Glycosyltransferase n=1 Tax=candidate division WS5 bacterium TaxID=2093353 RepID=A0A419DE95_9BACT|nr:MAG: glycosyltransferase [candidate division WS5 bacterium]
MNKKINLLSVVIPCKNQAEGLKKTLNDILEHSKKITDIEIEVVFVDGDCSDNSPGVAESFKDKFKHMQILHEQDLEIHPGFSGKGAAVKAGMARAKGDIKMFMDADSSTPFKEIYKLLPYFNGEYDVIMGSRYIDKPLPATNNTLKAFWHSLKEVFEVLIYGYSKSNTMIKKQGRLRQLISRGGNLAFVVLLGQSFADTRCGFKAYKKEVAETLFGLQQLPGFGFDTELLVIAKKYHYKIIEVPVTWINDAEESNLTLIDGFKTFGEIFKIRWYKLSGRYSKKTK